MASPEKSYVSSPRRSEGHRSPDRDDQEKPTYIRFLVSNLDAGCIIGRGGSTISEFQSLSGSHIQLSRNHELFPGTSERIIMISGVLDEILKATDLILEKLTNEMQAEGSSDAEIITKVRLVVPNNSCGGVIGKGGSTIKSLIEDSHAGIKISPLDYNFVGLSDRLATITGSLGECMHAIELIMFKLIEDAHYSMSAISPYPYAGVTAVHGIPFGYTFPPVTYSPVNYMPNGVGGKYPGNKGIMPPLVSTSSPTGASEGQGISVTIGVADKHIGAVIGRGGRNIMEIIQTSRARIKISDRSDFIPGTSDRKVTITGSREAIRAAEDMIMRKVQSVSER